jgi:hypothetical protein
MAILLYAVESAGGSWYRFVVTGSIVGGRLKTPADADAESLQVPDSLFSVQKVFSFAGPFSGTKIVTGK